MPLREFHCGHCDRDFETLIRNSADMELVSCPYCSAIDNLQLKFSLPSTHYTIAGNNSASTRPKGR
jgi:putative FmdB family regulatory protein